MRSGSLLSVFKTALHVMLSSVKGSEIYTGEIHSARPPLSRQGSRSVCASVVTIQTLSRFQKTSERKLYGGSNSRRSNPPSQKTMAIGRWMTANGGPSEARRAKEGAWADSAEGMKDTTRVSAWRLHFNLAPTGSRSW